jgi:hypothetical protein
VFIGRIYTLEVVFSVYGIPVYHMGRLIAEAWVDTLTSHQGYTTVKVSKNTLRELEHLREKMGARSIEEVLRVLLRSYRVQLLEKLHGANPRLREYSEHDRGEERWT